MNSNKKSISLIIFIFILVILLTILSIFIPTSKIAQSELGHLISLFINMNRININIKDKDIKNKIIIKWNNDVIYNKKLYKNNIYKNRNKYGENKFTVLYNNEILLTKVHFKTNSWHYHDYFFEFTNIDNKVKCKLKIIGPDSKIIDG